MKKIELINTYVEDDAIRYQVREDKGLGLLQQEVVDLFIRFHGDEHFDYDLTKCPLSILQLPIALYMLPITYFYNVELVIPEMDKVLYEHLQGIYDAYSKIYGPFKSEWRGKLSVGKIVENTTVSESKYEKVVFFSGGVDACHAGINNPGKKSLLVSIPDIEYLAKNDGPLREEKFSLIKAFSKVVDSNWMLVSNNFNASLFKDREINQYLNKGRGLRTEAFKFDGWAGIKYIANMCSIAPIAYFSGVRSLIMGSSFEQIEDELRVNYDGANPDITNSIKFAYISFAEQDGFIVRRSKKVSNIIEWCKAHGARTKMWACFTDGSSQCGFCMKCVRTQLNILSAGENPKDWGFDNFSESDLTKHVKSFKYIESNPCWIWDTIDMIDEDRTYPYCNELLHWMKSIGYKEYHRMAHLKSKPSMLKKITSIQKYPYYLKVLIAKVIKY